MNEEKELRAIKLEFEAELKNMFNTRRDDVGLYIHRVEIITDDLTGECLSVKIREHEIII